MKKSLIYPLLSIALSATSCTGCMDSPQNNGKEETERNDSVSVLLPDTAFYGHLGEGTGMSCLELVTENGDTLVLNKTDEQTGDLGRILGEIANYTDRYAVTTRNDRQSVLIALNVSQLVQRDWTSDADSLQGFRLDEDGKAHATAGGKQTDKLWNLYNCQLVLQGEDGSGKAATQRQDTLDILELTPDSLVLRDIHTRNIEKYHRTAQDD